MPKTVTLDRQAVVNLLVEVKAVCDVHEALAGTDSPRVVRGLESAYASVYREVFGRWEDDEDTSEIVCDAADARAREIVSWLATPREGVDG